ncbi:FecR family protein [Sphingomonas sp. ID0503]|uniref:FecR family protein n=1 Tax=Sphingomonas sp. ID0503 TaxID=3399691 RepID=UPI003AFA8396
MPRDRTTIENEALDWLIGQRDPAFADWEGFQNWLEADAAHPPVYHEMAAAEAEIGEILSQRRPRQIMPAAQQPKVARRAWLGGGIAAMLAVAIGVASVDRASPYAVETGPGERRSVTLADGTQIALNGSTRLTLDHKDQRVATLDRGEAVFTVTHDETDPFTVSVGDAELVDVGTVFNVVRMAGRTEVQVAEGAVMFNPDAEAVRLDAGQSLTVLDAETAIRRGQVAPGDVASWREGRLIYDGQTMAEVAAQLARYTGKPVRAAPEVAERRFRGVLSLGDHEDVSSLGPILGVGVRRIGTEWVLTPR